LFKVDFVTVNTEGMKETDELAGGNVGLESATAREKKRQN
jgi:hypothetical protein